MLSIFKRVAKFNKDAGTQLNKEELSKSEAENEINMLGEEYQELCRAFFPDADNEEGIEYNPDRVEIADALGDIIYVAMGTMAKLGIDYEKVMNEICTSNETKYTDGVLIKNEAGKIQKGPNFRKPDLSFVSEVEQIDAEASQKGDITVSSEDNDPQLKLPLQLVKRVS